VNWVDAAVLAVVALSALLAFMRGLVRELLSIGAWVGAGYFADYTVDLVRDRITKAEGQPDLKKPTSLRGVVGVWDCETAIGQPDRHRSMSVSRQVTIPLIGGTEWPRLIAS